MNEIKVKVEVEKKLVIPQLRRLDAASDDMHCIVNNEFAYRNCRGVSCCAECICNIDNLMMLANSQNLQLL